MAAFPYVTASLRSPAVALSFLMTGSAAFADVTAAEVWTDWQAYMAGSGYTVTAQQSRAGDRLTVSDITMTMDIPDEDGTITVGLGEITFTENGDGTVTVTVPETLPMTFSLEGDDSEEVTGRFDYLTTAFDMVASGDPDDILYAYSADEIAMEMRELMVEGQSVDMGTLRFAMADVDGSSRMQAGDLRRSDQSLDAGPVTYAIDMADPEGEEGRLVMNGQIAALAVKAAVAMPKEMDGADMAAAIAAGFDADARLTYETGATEFRFEENGDTVQGTSSSDGGEFTVALGEGGLNYAFLTKGIKMMLAGGEIPFPVEFAMQETGFTLTSPIMASDAPQDFALGLRMAGFTMSDGIWAIFDPEARLPRNPATIDIDTTGTARLSVNLLDPDEMERIEDGTEMPGELNALNLNALVLRAMGAELTGEGSFTFDNSDLQSFAGFPAPDGAVNLRLQGANGLLDTLIAMGYLPEDQAMGVRMMMGMFAVPGEGEDVLTSTIQVRPDGQVLANGQRLR